MGHFIEKCQYGYTHRQCRCPGGTVTLHECKSPWRHAEVRRSAFDWCALFKVQIMDPDGWRNNDGVDLTTPITLDDFKDRYAESTVNSLHGHPLLTGR